MSEMSVSITVKLENGKTMELSMEESLELYNKLHKLIGYNNLTIGDYPYYPTYPITWKSNTGSPDRLH